MFTNCVALWVANLKLTCGQTLEFFLRNVKEVTLYSTMSFFLLWSIFIYNFLHGVYMELQLDLPLLFTSDASMVSIDVCSNQVGDEYVAFADVDLLKPLEVSSFHVVLSLRELLQNKKNPLNLAF